MDKIKNNISVLLALLEQHTKLHYFSIGLTAVAFVIYILQIDFFDSELALSVTILILLTILLGLYEILLAIRVGFDIKLIQRLIQPDADIASELKSIDTALIHFKLIPTDKAGRELDIRLDGVKRLFKKQITICVLQIVCLILIGSL